VRADKQAMESAAGRPVAGKAGPEEVYQRLDWTSPAPYPRSWYPRKLAWELARILLFRWTPRRLNGWRVWLLRRFGARIAPSAVVRPSARVWHPWILEMGEHACLAEGVVVYNLGRIVIGDHTVVSQNAELCAGTHDYRKRELPLVRPEIVLGNGVWVCARAFVGPGVTVGDNAIVGACAVVTRDVSAGMIVGGNPAREIKPRPVPEGMSRRPG
jgi:putative colanic acid biosynthesis acetyltransferase WcaF